MRDGRVQSMNSRSSAQLECSLCDSQLYATASFETATKRQKKGRQFLYFGIHPLPVWNTVDGEPARLENHENVCVVCFSGGPTRRLLTRSEIERREKRRRVCLSALFQPEGAIPTTRSKRLLSSSFWQYSIIPEADHAD